MTFDVDDPQFSLLNSLNLDMRVWARFQVERQKGFISPTWLVMQSIRNLKVEKKKKDDGSLDYERKTHIPKAVSYATALCIEKALDDKEHWRGHGLELRILQIFYLHDKANESVRRCANAVGIEYWRVKPYLRAALLHLSSRIY